MIFQKNPHVTNLPLVFKMSYSISVGPMLLNLLWESNFSCPNKTEITCSSDKAQSKQGQLLYFCREIMVSVSWAAEPPVNHKQITDTLVCSPFTIQEMRNYSSGLTVTPINLLPHNCSFIQKNGDSTHKNFTLMTARKKNPQHFLPLW